MDKKDRQPDSEHISEVDSVHFSGNLDVRHMRTKKIKDDALNFGLNNWVVIFIKMGDPCKGKGQVKKLKKIKDSAWISTYTKYSNRSSVWSLEKGLG